MVAAFRLVISPAPVMEPKVTPVWPLRFNVAGASKVSGERAGKALDPAIRTPSRTMVAPE